MSLESRLTKLEQIHSSPQCGVVTYLLAGGYEYQGKTYQEWEDLPAGSFFLVPAQLSIEDWEARSEHGAQDSFYQQWGI